MPTTYTASNSGNTATGSVTIPAGMPTGSVGFVIFQQNNTDAITATSTWLTLIDSSSSGSTSQVDKVYSFVIGDGTAGTVTAGSIASFTLSATRAWSATLYGMSGVNQSNPISVIAVAGTASTSSAVIPSATTTEAFYLVEAVVFKANGTAITGFTAATGWTQRVTTASPTTFGPACTIADLDNGLAGAGAYGGDTYTPNPATTSTAQRYLIGFRPQPVTLTTYTPSADITTTGWSKVGAAASFALALGDNDNTTYAESAANPAGAILEEAIPAATVPTDLSTASYTADLWWANSATTATAVMALVQNGTVKVTGPTLTLTSTPTTYTLALTSTQAGTLTKTGTQWQGLSLRVTVTAS